ncbi:acetyltransferase [Roseateles sp. YR242]|uniref:GNAT family N-acetyltransferase n=1 Tax=Roseateles sp. YR242 TaxID=1855305 RepID=UPI0008D4C63B|nr:GNAT family N-acetyltransferase [Roseateles sp. YR242]SEK69790.1 acetyltransferase [Roseateles sp. YR242]
MDLIKLGREDHDWIPSLGELFFDAVDGGASLGFLADVDEPQMREYWEAVFEQLGPRHHLWVMRKGTQAVGTVQLALCGKPNGRHRADLQKLMVHRDARRSGVAGQLMAAAEGAAREAGISLLVLDTEAQSPAEAFYQGQGWQRTGEIPFFATNPDGTLRATALYWKRLG